MDKAYDRIYLQKLAHKYKQGTLTAEEQAYYDTWYNHFVDEELEVSEQPDVIRDRMLHIIESHVQKRKPAVVKHLWKYATVAVLLLSLSIIACIFYLHQRKPLQPVTQIDQIKPGSNGAVLTLANGKKIVLEQTSQGVIAQQGNAALQKENDSLLVYRKGNAEQLAIASYNTLETPAGRQYQVMLPDGTKVWLNASSSLQYPTNFSGKERTVTLTGEGYFEVAKDKAHPFIVHSLGQEIKVLGTHFNVNAYADEKKITTTLLEGSVQVTAHQKSILIKPGEQAIANDKGISTAPADMDIMTAWIKGRIAFKKTDLRSVLRQISRWYNIEVEYQGEIPNETITGEVSRQADLSAMLDILRLSDIHYVQKGHKLTIIP